MPHSVIVVRKEHSQNVAKNYGEHLSNVLAWWVDVVRRKAGWVIVLACLVSGASFYYTINHLGINTDTAEMLSETVPFRRNYSAFQEAFPQFDDAMLIVIDGETPELARDASVALTARLLQETNLFSTAPKTAASWPNYPPDLEVLSY